MKARLRKPIETHPGADKKDALDRADQLKVGEVYDFHPFIEWFDEPCITCDIFAGNWDERPEIAYSGKHSEGYNHLDDFLGDWEILQEPFVNVVSEDKGTN